MKINYRVNNLILNKIVKLIDSKSNFLGYFKLEDCLKKSIELKTDLIEIGTKDSFSICKLIKFNKFKYFKLKKLKKLNQNKILKTQKKKIKIKEIKFHLFTAANDYNKKIEHIKDFLTKGLKVKVSFIIKGREILKDNIIKDNVDNIILNIKDFGILNTYPNLSKKTIFFYFDPKNAKKKNQEIHKEKIINIYKKGF